MNASLCPHCNQHCLSFWSKSLLGPATSKCCRSCGKRVSVPWLFSMLLLTAANVLSLACGVALVMAVGSMPLGWLPVVFVVGMLLGSIPTLWLYHRFVPLVARAD